MNAYQQKWIDVLKAANLPNWQIESAEDTILIKMPNVTDLKVIRDNLPTIIAQLSLDITEVTKHRLVFIFENGRERFEYTLNPGEHDLGADGIKEYEQDADDL